MMGSTETENGYSGPPPYDLSDEDMLAEFTRLANDNDAKARELIAIYRRTHPRHRNQMLWLTAQSDATRRWNAQMLGLLKYEQAAAPSYLYLFDWYSPVYDDRMGAYHCLEIPFHFYNVDIATSMTGSGQDRYALAHKMSAAWAAFARNGNPNHPDIPTWPAFNPSDWPTMLFGGEVRMANDPNREARLALAALR
jgi:para-nitrobenzyl esterase